MTEEESVAARRMLAQLERNLQEDTAALEELENQIPAKAAFDERASRSEDYCRVLQSQLAELEGELERRR